MGEKQRVVVETVVRKDILSRFFFFTVFFHKKSTIPVLAFSVLTGIILLFYDLTLSLVVLSFNVFHFWNILKNHRNYIQYSQKDIGVRQNIEISDGGIKVTYPEQDRQETYSWQTIKKTAELPKLVMLYLDYATAVLIPKECLDQQQLLLLRQIIKNNIRRKR